jgi:type VI secretion system protein ImpJ
MSATSKKTDHNKYPCKPIYWQEGLFLQPHHFQWQDLYLQSQIEPLNRYLQPSFWGTGRISIREASLSNHIFSVGKGEFRFRDLTHVTYPGNAVLESRNFEQQWDDKSKPFTVYLGIHKLSDSEKNVSDPQDYKSFSLVPTRFVAEREIEMLSDLYAGGERLPVERISYVLKLLWEQEISSIGDYEVMPIARLESRKGEIVIMPDYIPPILCLSGSEALMQNIKTINELAGSTSNRLESSKRDRGVHTAEFGTKDMVYILTLRTLNRFTPILRHMLGNPGAVHPWTVYGLLSQFIGELSTFSTKINLADMNAESPFFLFDYDHEKLTSCFNRANYILARLMADISSEPEYVAPLVYNGNFFQADLVSKLLQGRKRFFLVVETESDSGQVVSELENQAKLSAAQHLPTLIAQSLRGIELTHIAHPPPGLPRRSMGLYFSINHNHRLWNQVCEKLNLALSWDTRPEAVKIELMIAGGDE